MSDVVLIMKKVFPLHPSMVVCKMALMVKKKKAEKEIQRYSDEN